MTVRLVATAAPLTPALGRACAPFGVLPVRPGAADPRPLDPGLLDGVLGANVVLVAGPSGSGKSTLVGGLVRALRERAEGVTVAPCPGELARDGSRSLADLLPGPVHARLGALARGGLAEAALLPRTPAELSAGERARLSVVLAMASAPRGSWVVGDEFAAVLDRATAQGVARTLTRWARAAGVRLILAAAHEDLPRLLDADLHVRTDHGAPARWGPGRPAEAPRIRLEPGTPEDHDALAPLHYRAARPATRALVRRAVRTLPCGGRRLAGVLVVSMPTLNASWRSLAWPGRFDAGDKRARALRLNRELRCVSRVIVEPASRGLGIARRLVEDYLRRPLTPATEAVARMGAFCPFFERAGMTAYPLSISPDDARLADALDARAVDPALPLAPEPAEALAADPLLARELARWCAARKLSRRLAPLTPGQRLRAASSLASSPGVAYAHGGAA